MLISIQTYSSRLRRECELSGSIKISGSLRKFCVIHEIEYEIQIWGTSPVHLWKSNRTDDADSIHVGLQSLRNVYGPIGLLIVLQNCDHRSSNGQTGPV